MPATYGGDEHHVGCRPVLLPVVCGAIAFAVRSPAAYVFPLLRVAEPCLAWKMVYVGFCVDPDYLITCTGAYRRRSRVRTKIPAECKIEIGAEDRSANRNR
jgi:hypothetical protein